MKESEIFRTTKDWYIKNVDYVSPALIKFTKKYAGNNILDIGCATGEYIHKLNIMGFKCTGIDINPKYTYEANKKGLDVHKMYGESTSFPDKSFDTILLFEVLEHSNHPDKILKEAKRVASKNILITVPNSTEFYFLKENGLTYSHMLDNDHVNFFTKDDLENELSKHFQKFKVEEKEPLKLGAINLPWILKYPILLLYKLKLIKTNIYYRLYAVVEVD